MFPWSSCTGNAAFGGDSSSRLANDTGVHAKRPVTVIALSVVNSLLGIIIVCILFRERKIILGQISRCLRCRKNEDVLDPTFFTNNSPSTMATSLNFTISPIYQPKSSEATKSNTNSSSQWYHSSLRMTWFFPEWPHSCLQTGSGSCPHAYNFSSFLWHIPMSEWFSCLMMSPWGLVACIPYNSSLQRFLSCCCFYSAVHLSMRTGFYTWSMPLYMTFAGYLCIHICTL